MEESRPQLPELDSKTSSNNDVTWCFLRIVGLSTFFRLTVRSGLTSTWQQLGILFANNQVAGTSVAFGLNEVISSVFFAKS